MTIFVQAIVIYVVVIVVDCDHCTKLMALFFACENENSMKINSFLVVQVLCWPACVLIVAVVSLSRIYSPTSASKELGAISVIHIDLCSLLPI